jgi:hypothetical protein
MSSQIRYANFKLSIYISKNSHLFLSISVSGDFTLFKKQSRPLINAAAALGAARGGDKN